MRESWSTEAKQEGDVILDFERGVEAMNKSISAVVVLTLCLLVGVVGCQADRVAPEHQKAVLRIQVIDFLGGSPYWGYKVKVLETLQNNSHFVIPSETCLERYSSRSHLTNGEYIVVLYRLGPSKENLWRITDVFTAQPKDLWTAPPRLKGLPIGDEF